MEMAIASSIVMVMVTTHLAPMIITMCYFYFGLTAVKKCYKLFQNQF